MISRLISLLLLATATCPGAAFSGVQTSNNNNYNNNGGPLHKPQSRAHLSSRVMDDVTVPSGPSSVPTISNTENMYPLLHESSEDTINNGSNSIGENDDQFNPYQLAARSTVALTAASYALNPEPLDAVTASIWSAVYHWEPAHAPLFEAEVASFGFFVWIASYSALHLFLGKKKTEASRFDGQMPHRPFEWAEPQNFHLWFNPLGSYLGSIWIYHQFLHEKAPLPEIAPTFGVFSVELMFGVFLYDLCFFPVHWLMHKSPWGQMRRVHGYHHRMSSHTLNSLETVQHSYIDGFLQVCVNILVQQITPFGAIGHKHVLSRLAHNLLVTYLLSEAHSGYDLPWMSHRLFPEVFGGAPRHEKHHHDGRVYYQQYFKYLDDFFGNTEDDLCIGDGRKEGSRGRKQQMLLE